MFCENSTKEQNVTAPQSLVTYTCVGEDGVNPEKYFSGKITMECSRAVLSPEAYEFVGHHWADACIAEGLETLMDPDDGDPKYSGLSDDIKGKALSSVDLYGRFEDAALRYSTEKSGYYPEKQAVLRMVLDEVVSEAEVDSSGANVPNF